MRREETSLTVILVAESGCGKELAERALHEASALRGEFVAVNCAAIPEILFESQLFGNRAGAFTGAVAHDGFFRAANGGTLFLDEIGDLPLTLQPKLLRAIQERAVVPLGTTRPIPCAVRIVAATNC
jgi:two-component system response regulator GlrR